MKVTNRVFQKRQTVMNWKLGLFAEQQEEDSRKIKSVMLGIMDGKGRRERPNGEWIDDIKKWCKNDLYSLTIFARDRKFWKQMMKFVLDTYRLSAHVSIMRLCMWYAWFCS